MTNLKVNARWAGASYFVTHVTSVTAAVMYGGGGFDPTRHLSGRSQVLTAALLEVVLAIAVVATSIALYPIALQLGRSLASGYVALRTLEASVILTGIVTVLPLVARPGISQAPAIDGPAATALLMMHDWAFLIGPGLICPANTGVLAWLLWRAGLRPRFIPALGLVGGPLVFGMNACVAAGITSPIALLVLPIFTWEISLATLLIFAPSRLLDLTRAT